LIRRDGRAVTERPTHVPPELVRDFDFLRMQGESDVHRWFKSLHDGPDLFWTPRQGGHWVATRFDDVEAILENDAAFSSEHASLPHAGKPFRLPLFESDEPLHGDYRRLLTPFFTPRAIADLEPRAREITVRLIDGFLARGSCEFMSEFALRMPIGIFMKMVDLPESDREGLLAIVNDAVRGTTPEVQMAAHQKAFAYMSGVFEQRRARPGDDLLSALAQGTVENGRPLSTQELCALGVFFIVAGLDTVAGALGFSMRFLALSPSHRRQIASDPSVIPEAVDELLRRHGIANVARVCRQDTVLGGVTIKAGDAMLIATALPGLDDRRFADPMAVDFSRANKKSLIFGRGPHVCIGQLLARVELKVFLQEWFARIPEFRIPDDAEVVAAPGLANAVLRLPLAWSR
jgi:cytochrome P450